MLLLVAALMGGVMEAPAGAVPGPDPFLTAAGCRTGLCPGPAPTGPPPGLLFLATALVAVGAASLAGPARTRR